MSAEEIAKQVEDARFARAQEIAVKYNHADGSLFNSPEDVQAWFVAEAGGDEALALQAAEIMMFAYKVSDAMAALGGLLDLVDIGGEDVE